MEKSLQTLLIIICVGFQSIGQDVHYTLVNPRVELEMNQYYHYVDVLTYSNEGFKLGSGQLYFNYDTVAFGPNIFANEQLEVIIPDSSILSEKVIAPPFEFPFYGDIITNDNTYNRFSFSWQHDFSNDCLFEQNMNQYSDVIFTIKIRYKDQMENADPGLCLEGSAVYVDQTFTACGPDPCSTSDCFNYPGAQITADFYSCSECLIVYSTNDAGVGSLREALTCAVDGDTIRFAPNLRSDSIILSSNQLDIAKDVSVIAKSSLRIVVNGDLVNRVFDILLDKQVLIEGVGLIAGQAQQGNGIRNDANLVLKNVTISYDNTSAPESVIQNLDSLTIQGVVQLRQLD